MSKKKQTYAELKNELEVILEKLQSNELDIDTALVLHEKAELLLERLERRISQAENSVVKKVAGETKKAAE